MIVPFPPARPLNILCDADAIAADLLGKWLIWYNAKYNDNLTIEHITEWDLHKFVKKECGYKIYDFIDTGDAYRDLDPLPGAVEAIKALDKAGHNVVMVSAGSKHPDTAGHKLEWFKRVLGFSRKKCIIGHQKELIRGDVFIDDSPPNIQKYRAAWPNTPIMTIAYPYNESVKDICWRADSYKDTLSAWTTMMHWINGIASGAGVPQQG